jgi:hypothetical protein
MVVLLFENHHMTMAIICRHATDGRATIDGLTSRHSRSSSTAARFALCAAIRATVACKKTCRMALRLKCTDIHFLGAQSLEFMPVASNGIKALPLFIRLRQGVASRATGTSCLGAARFSKLRGRLHGLVVNVANWSDANRNRLEPHEPEPTDVVVTLGSKH